MEIWCQEGDFWVRKNTFGDFDFNHCSKCIMDGDTSEWVINSFFKMAELLNDRKRWPDGVAPENVAKNRYVYYFLRFFRQIFAKFGVKIYSQWRPQSDMTRDPYIAFGALYAMLLGSHGGKYDLLLHMTYKSVTIPVYVYRPNTWAWRKRLINPLKTPFYVLRLRYLKALATVKVYESLYKIWNDD